MPWTVYNSDGKVLQSAEVGSNSITNVKMADDAVDSAEIVAGAVDLAHMSVNSIDSDQYVDGSIDLAHMSVNSIDSDQYVDGSIDNAHLADDAVGVAELSATGTASSSTFLRGDNAWAAAGGGAVTRAGGNLSEATSTSTTAADALAIGSLSIATTSPISMHVVMRKTSGHGSAVGWGFKVNSTITGDANSAGGHRLWTTNTADSAQNGCVQPFTGARITNYAHGLFTFGSGANPTAQSAGGVIIMQSDMPVATVTDLVVMQKTANASNTGGTDEFNAYTLAIS